MYKILLIFSLITIFAFGCKKSDIATGLYGKIRYGKDNITVGSPEDLNKDYDLKYKGRIYFINYNTYIAIPQTRASYDSIKAISPSTEAKRGKYEIALEANTYIAITEDGYLNEMVIVNSNEFKERDFNFFIYTSN